MGGYSRDLDLDAVAPPVLNSSTASESPTAATSIGLAGKLFRYRTSPSSLQAFESPVHHSYTRFCLYVGGLTDGLLACPYVEALAAECDSRGWALVQPIISSSYAGYGCSSLATDVVELAECLDFLIRMRGATAFVVIGHSTGCQDAVHLLATAPTKLRKVIRGVVLQAPVSDREAASLEDGADARATMLAEAQRLVANGQGKSLLPELHYGFVPINADRFASLVGRSGPDDLFSSDFSDSDLRARLAHLSTAGQQQARGELATEAIPEHPGLKVLFVHSVGEEYVPAHVDIPALSRRFVAAAGAESSDARALLIEAASHNLSQGADATEIFITAVGSFLAELLDGPLVVDADF